MLASSFQNWKANRVDDDQGAWQGQTFALVASTHVAHLGENACGADGLVEAVRFFRNDEFYVLAELPDDSRAVCVIGNTVNINGRGEEAMEAK